MQCLQQYQKTFNYDKRVKLCVSVCECVCVCVCVTVCVLNLFGNAPSAIYFASADL